MSEIVTAINLDPANITALSGLSADVVGGSGAAPVFNVLNFIPNGFVIYGQGEQAEIFKTLNISSQTINILGTFAFTHRKNQLVQQVLGDTIDFYYAADIGTGYAPPNASFQLLGSTVISPDQAYTTFLHQTGGAGYWYKYVYRNSATGDVTDLADSEAIRGGGYGRLVSINQILTESGIKDYSSVDLTSVSLYRTAAEDEVKGKLASAGYVVPLVTQDNIFYTPPIVSNIARKLAAGLFLMQNFGTTRVSTGKDGASKAEEARNLLAEIQLNDLVLLDPNGNMMQKPTLVDGYPDDSTQTVDPDGNTVNGPIMTMNKVF